MRLTTMPGLSERERRIIPCLMHRADASIKELSALCGLREHVVRYVCDTLREKQIAGRRKPFINTYPLGYVGYTLYCSLNATSAKNVDEFIAAIRKESLVSWAARLSGEFEFAIAFLCRRPEELSSAMSRIASDCGDIFAERHLTTTLRFHSHVRKYLSASKRKLPSMYFGLLDTPRRIDEIDERILRGMADGVYDSHRQLAVKLGFQPTLLDRRVDRLRELGIISGFISGIDLSSLGAQTHRLFLSIASPSLLVSKKLERFCKEHPHVLRFIETVGAWDFEIELEVWNVEELFAAIQELKGLLTSQLVRLRSAQVLRHLKYLSYPNRAETSK